MESFVRRSLVGVLALAVGAAVFSTIMGITIKKPIAERTSSGVFISG